MAPSALVRRAVLFAEEAECEFNTRTAESCTTVCIRVLRAVGASLNELLVPAWETETLTSKRGTREGNRCQGVRQFRTREPFVSKIGTFA